MTPHLSRIKDIDQENTQYYGVRKTTDYDTKITNIIYKYTNIDIIRLVTNFDLEITQIENKIRNASVYIKRIDWKLKTNK